MDVHFGESKIRTVNFYSPPGTNEAQDIFDSIEDQTAIVAGDANAHHQSWHSSIEEDQLGTKLFSKIEESNLVIMNEYGQNRRALDDSSRNSSPDISLCSEDIALQSE